MGEVTATGRDRSPWADLARVLAILGVVVIHSSGLQFIRYPVLPQADWAGVVLLDALARCSVPLFAMISGALILKPGAEAVTLRYVARRVTRVFIPLATWGIFYLLYLSYNSGKSPHWRSVFTEPPMYHLWFAYMIIGLYLILPVLDAVFQYLLGRRSLQWYLLALWVVVTSVTAYVSIPLLGVMQLTSMLGYGGYFVMGGIIAASGRGKTPTNLWWVIYLIGAAVTTLLTVYFTEQAGVANEFARAYFTPNVFVTAFAAFVLLTRARLGATATRVFAWASDLAFMVFFMHVLFLERVASLLAPLATYIPATAIAVLASMTTFAVCLAIAAALRFLPWSKRVLG